MNIKNQGLLSRNSMVNRGASGHLATAYERFIPLDKLDGLEPRPSNNESDDGEYHAGRRIEVPIEAQYDSATDKYMLFAGNHRVAQARANGQKYIIGFVEPDSQLGPRAIGDHARLTDPDAAIWLKGKIAKVESELREEERPVLGPVHSKEWFDSVLTPFNGDDRVPDGIRNMAEDFCTSFQIKGIVDPLYVANAIAHKIGVGDGSGKFSGDAKNLEAEQIQAIATRLEQSYTVAMNQSGCEQSAVDVIANALRRSRRPQHRP